MSDLLKEGELLSVLGTLAYSPESVQAVLEENAKDERYSIDSSLLYRGWTLLSLANRHSAYQLESNLGLSAYPTLQQALFPIPPHEHNKDAYGEDDENASRGWLQTVNPNFTRLTCCIYVDLKSGKSDVTLVELISETTPFAAAKDIVCTAPGQELPHFPKNRGDGSLTNAEVLEDTLDVHYYLAQARPFHAYHRMLHSIKEALSSPLLAPYVLLASIPASFFTRPLKERSPNVDGIIPLSPDEVRTSLISAKRFPIV